MAERPRHRAAFRRPSAAPDFEQMDFAGDVEPELPADEFDEPTDPADSHPAESGRRGCGWLLLFILIGLTALCGVAWWGIQEISRRNLVQKLDKSFYHVSLLPRPRLETPQPELKLQVFYVIDDSRLAPQTLELRSSADSVERAHVIAREMLRPPSTGVLKSPLPPGVSIRALYVYDGIIWLDLNEAFLNPPHPSPEHERLVVFAIVNNFMLNDPTFKGVRFMVEGKPIDSAWGWLDLSSPLGPDLSLIQ